MTISRGRYTDIVRRCMWVGRYLRLSERGVACFLLDMMRAMPHDLLPAANSSRFFFSGPEQVPRRPTRTRARDHAILAFIDVGPTPARRLARVRRQGVESPDVFAAHIYDDVRSETSATPAGRKKTATRHMHTIFIILPAAHYTCCLNV